MDLPKADDLRAFLAALRDGGVTRFRLGALEVTLAPAPARSVVEEINQASPLPPDPLDVIRGKVPNGRQAPDVLDWMASGGRLIEVSDPDPTRPG